MGDGEKCDAGLCGMHAVVAKSQMRKNIRCNKHGCLSCSLCCDPLHMDTLCMAIFQLCILRAAFISHIS